jgi:uncharacterized damage-inducible protein DinB
MNRREMLGAVVAAAVAAPLAVEADDITTWVGWWRRSKAYTLAIADAMPEADYNFAPFGAGAADGVRAGDGARTFAQVMQHIAQAEGFYLGRFGKGTPPAAPQNDTTKATTLEYLGDTFDWSIAVVGQLTPADLAATIAGGRGPAMTGLDLLLNAMVHTGHTRGYADMYLRNRGVKPPAYRV